MKTIFPSLEEMREDELIEIFKTVVNLDREVRKAKEELREEGKLKITEKEKELINNLEQEKMLELGYEPGYNQKLKF